QFFVGDVASASNDGARKLRDRVQPFIRNVIVISQRIDYGFSEMRALVSHDCMAGHAESAAMRGGSRNLYRLALGEPQPAARVYPRQCLIGLKSNGGVGKEPYEIWQ